MTPTWLVRRPKRPARGVLMVGCRLLVSAGLLGGCSSPSSPPQTAVYSAVSVNGHPLPAIYFAAGDSDGVLRTTLEAVAARLELRPDGTFERNREVNRKLDGEIVESLRTIVTGTFERTDTTIVLRFRNPGGATTRRSYIIFSKMGACCAGFRSSPRCGNGYVRNRLRSGTPSAMVQSRRAASGHAA